ncbi:hypothetical protein G6F57_009639 [Rhizopus arrhizus]|uniref:Uncharacterized protein n=1 Tax=Rhizopus oryzae TaxID=64495 RepID=A0A9P6X3D2_RHIOR|nr:hypothetical protein G6F23_007952 [Rhizopus arrhizus]KAG1414813.1 hypothetical protein G6F58_006776 [Rhizopus delemar]KAG0784020.1 hypothetical protein G6F22_008462 [Rhizopus arrhizus]KAG0790247.1 hypothetical protein G6F21_005949 [Rhizopus arrhizus]KAG0812944.1 hypothetical protein G6F20_005951 [Rhizopus arrhizus]
MPSITPLATINVKEKPLRVLLDPDWMVHALDLLGRLTGQSSVFKQASSSKRGQVMPIVSGCEGTGVHQTPVDDHEPENREPSAVLTCDGVRFVLGDECIRLEPIKR